MAQACNGQRKRQEHKKHFKILRQCETSRLNVHPLWMGFNAMQVVAKIERLKDVMGILYLSSIGYHWKIYRKTNGKREQVAQSYYYTSDKQKAYKSLQDNYDIITGFTCDLFNYKIKERE